MEQKLQSCRKAILTVTNPKTSSLSSFSEIQAPTDNDETSMQGINADYQFDFLFSASNYRHYGATCSACK